MFVVLYIGRGGRLLAMAPVFYHREGAEKAAKALDKHWIIEVTNANIKAAAQATSRRP